jgi:hypothetical protein
MSDTIWPQPKTPFPSIQARLRSTALAIAPLLALYVLYTLVRFFVRDRGPLYGTMNALEVIHFEKRFGFFWEPAIQGEILAHDHLIRLANIYYSYGFLPVLVITALIAAWRMPAVFKRWRRVFVISLALASIGYTLFPLTPPRMVSGFGFVDTLALVGPHYYGDETGKSLFNAYGSLPSLVNVYAAMPSMHVAWSVIVGQLLMRIFPERLWVRIAGWLHPVVMATAVVVTANHYLLDIIVGLLVLLVAILVGSKWARIPMLGRLPI